MLLRHERWLPDCASSGWNGRSFVQPARCLLFKWCGICLDVLLCAAVDILMPALLPKSCSEADDVIYTVNGTNASGECRMRKMTWPHLFSVPSACPTPSASQYITRRRSTRYQCCPYRAVQCTSIAHSSRKRWVDTDDGMYTKLSTASAQTHSRVLCTASRRGVFNEKCITKLVNVDAYLPNLNASQLTLMYTYHCEMSVFCFERRVLPCGSDSGENWAQTQLCM